MFNPQNEPAPDCDPSSDGPAPELDQRYWPGWEVRMGADFMDDDLPGGPVFVWKKDGVRLLLDGDTYGEYDWLLFPPYCKKDGGA